MSFTVCMKVAFKNYEVVSFVVSSRQLEDNLKLIKAHIYTTSYGVPVGVVTAIGIDG